jgi:16S rRNA pseudouridine516 synthase
MRLDKYIANSTGLSRSEVKRLIKAGEIAINREVAADPAIHINTLADKVAFKGQALSESLPRYYMLHKPKGYVCSSNDAEHPIALDLIEEDKKQKLHFAGRLDKDTTGLVLITDDGQWSHRITTPSSACSKYYSVTLEQPLAKHLPEVFEKGIQLKNEKRLTQPSQLIIKDDYHATLILQEGKYHQVKRMFAAIDNHVTELHRTQIGGVVLDPQLAQGEYRPLTSTEIASFNAR